MSLGVKCEQVCTEHRYATNIGLASLHVQGRLRGPSALHADAHLRAAIILPAALTLGRDCSITDKLPCPGVGDRQTETAWLVIQCSSGFLPPLSEAWPLPSSSV